MNLFIILIVAVLSWMYNDVKTYQIVYFKCAQFIIGALEEVSSRCYEQMVHGRVL